ncbi:hypothetical protein LIER_37189 [Lithospermum erythrorhizon]|uniref:Uncharacterized protein n=1 Tax=Lithospermum erythrorhizon TaxID=34254 RepID=A0AAV3PKM2_LITER
MRADDTYMALYGEKNLFSVRVHYHGRFVANPSLSYEGGKVKLFDCCDADTFELVHENDKEDNVDDEGNENDKEDDVGNEEEENDFEYSESEESDSEDNGEDEDLNPENVLYGKEQDGFDVGDLPGSQPSLSATFLENIEETFVVPEHNGHSEIDGEVHSDDSDDVVEPT